MLVQRRVAPEYLAALRRGARRAGRPVDDLSEAGFFYALDRGDPDDDRPRCCCGSAERAFYRWLEDVCLDESNGAFEVENSPFASREAEVLRARSPRHGRASVARARELAPVPAPARQPRLRCACSASSSAGSCASTTSTTPPR